MRAAHYVGSSGPTLRHQASNSLVELHLDDPRWMDLAAVAPAATVFHLPAWNHVIYDTYGYRSALLVNLDHRGRVMAGVPAIGVRRLEGAMRQIIRHSPAVVCRALGGVFYRYVA